ncbi:competence protein [Virgibacillus profundi]|uniref:Competence protein n=1 Tax=Virgibacillus profundi TaxID=2024555 RepID=A0A2A2II82_9BACI|nr:competence protein ComK [Virgibacillus profundi]PAV31327.1 competence protein [Virgibacillus profundi]PXY55512.1 competence protein [Virgibacillus profundi]
MGDGRRPVYIITQRTKAIMFDASAYYRSRILEVGEEKFSRHNPEQIIDNSCLVYGASLDGRKSPVKEILNSVSKLPVPVNVDKGIYMIPTASTKNKDCVWVSYQHILTYEQRGDQTYIAFRDGTGIYVNISEKAFDIQYKRTSQVIVHMNRGTLFGKHWYPWW